jgi:hypothetical protein
VDAAIAEADKAGKSGSITLTCGKLMTGVTVPQWGAILMLRSLKSPESYFQSAFRVQSPWSQRLPGGERQVLKNTCFVFEFDPNRGVGRLEPQCVPGSNTRFGVRAAWCSKTARMVGSL